MAIQGASGTNCQLIWEELNENCSLIQYAAYGRDLAISDYSQTSHGYVRNI